ncbi:MAG TPA: isochorismatase family protein [Streptosporangiaceae bacterium]|nr:isochorismatase family protein [Streptosporangiaceae bacterium]
MQLASGYEHPRRTVVAVLIVAAAGLGVRVDRIGDPLVSAARLMLAKRNADSFIGTDLDKRLRDLGVSRVVVTGLATEFCVDSTCRAALSRGYYLTLVEDGYSTPTPPPDSRLSAEAIVARYNQVLGWIDYPDRDITVTPAADVTFG